MGCCKDHPVPGTAQQLEVTAPAVGPGDELTGRGNARTRYLEGQGHRPEQREGFLPVPVHNVLGQDGAPCRREPSAPHQHRVGPGPRGAAARLPALALTLLVL